MSNDDLIPTLPDSNEDEKTTQPTITGVFRLLRELEKGQKGLNTRLDEVESRLGREIAGVNTRLVEMSDEMKSGFLQLADKIDRSRLHAEADYHDLLRRIRELESRAS